ncbi:spherulation-specific family 4 protein [Streptomyces sp. NPDC002536]
MSHLTSGHRRFLATGKAPLRLGVPGFAHPLVAPAEWGGLQRAGLPLDWVVLGGAGGGPGSRPDPCWRAAAAPLREAGVRLLGHLDLASGTRPLGELLSDAQRFLNWYKVDGFALGRCPADAAGLKETRRAAGALRTLRDGTHLVLLQGTHPCPGYVSLADQLVTFAGSWSAYRWSQVAEWTADHPPERFCHLVYGVPRSHLDEAMRIARWQGAGTVFFTDRTSHASRTGRAHRAGRAGRAAPLTFVRVDPWESLPGYWDEFVSRIGPGVSE